MATRVLIFMALLSVIGINRPYCQIIDVTDLYQTNDILFPGFERVGEEQGFHHRRISTLLEDHFGYIWIGTIESGLWKYDGYEFESFQVDYNNPFSLPGNDINCLVEDSRNILWIGTNNGLCFFNPIYQCFTKIELPAHNEKQRNTKFINCITEDDEGRLIVGTLGMVYIISKIDKHDFEGCENPIVKPDSSILSYSVCKLTEGQSNLSGQTIYDLQLDNKGNLWMAMNNSVGILDIDTSKTTDAKTRQISVCSGMYHKQAKGRFIRSLYIDETDKVWFQSMDTLNCLIPTKDQYELKKIAIPADGSMEIDYSNTCLTDTSMKLWFGSISNALHLFDSDDEVFYPLTFQTENSSPGIRNYGISNILRSRGNVIFIATYWGGLYRFNPIDILSNFHPDIQKFHKSKIHNLRYVYLDSKDYLWLICDELYMIDRYTGEIIKTLDDNLFKQEWCYKNKLLEDSKGNYWLSMEGQGLIRFSLNGQVSKNKPLDIEVEKVIDNCLVTDIHEDGEENIWVGLLYANKGLGFNITGLAQIDSSGNLIATHSIKEWSGASPERPRMFIYNIYADPQGFIWLATGFGLVKYDPVQKLNETFTYPVQNPGIYGFSMLSVCPDPINNGKQLWIGTSGGGLISFDTESKEFKEFTQYQEITGKNVSSIAITTDGYLWTASEVGIARIGLSKENSIESHTLYGAESGLSTRDFTNYYGNNAQNTTDKELVFSGPQGFQILDAAGPLQDTINLAVYLTDFFIDFEPANAGQVNSPLINSIEYTDNISLAYDKSTIGFKLTSPSMKSLDQVHYSFMLDGYDKDWILNGNDRTIHYTKLPPGEYTLFYKASDSYSGRGEAVKGPKIVISPPWWLSNLAYAGYIILLFAIVYIIIRIWMNRQKMRLAMEINQMETQKLKELDSMKSRFFANISHEFRTPLTLIMNPLYEMIEKDEYRKDHTTLNMIMRNSKRLLHFSSELLELSKLDDNRLKLVQRKVDVVTFSHYIISSYESWAESKKIGLEFNVPDKGCVFYLDPEKYHTILSNLLTNALKYTRKNGMIVINIELCHGDRHDACSMKRPCLLISVKDYGRGIPSDQIPYIFNRYYRLKRDEEEGEHGTGLGLSLVKGLVHLHQGSIDAKSEVGKYTEFSIRFPHIETSEVSEEIYKGYALDDTEPVKQNDKIPSDKNNVKIDKTDIRKIILIIEDSKDMRFVLTSNLGKEYRVLQAENGKVGANIAINEIPDLIISDVMMPEMNGLEVTQLLKLNEITSHIPIILLTARAEMDDKLDGLQIGADDYLIKPFNRKELKVRIKNLLEQREVLKEKFSKQNILSIKDQQFQSADKLFLEKIITLIEDNLSNEELNVQMIYEKMAISRTQLHRKLKALTDKSANELIRSVRLERAAEMIQNNVANISEIAFRVGFTSPPYFTKAFNAYFGCSPSAYRKNKTDKQ